jgi:hypothetical protein
VKNENYKNYFLGLLSADAVETLELRIISDNEVEAELLEAENNLVEKYLDNKLVNEETQAFNENYLITNERSERVSLINKLRNYEPQNSESKKTKLGFFEQLKIFVTLRPVSFGLASLALILAVGIAWQIALRSNVNVAQTELVAINNQDLSNLETLKDYKKVSLINGNLRSGGNGNSLSEKDLTERVLMQLILPNKTDSTQSFAVKISKDGQIKQTFTQKSYEKEVRILIPKSMLTKGEYQITLEKESEKYNYYFSVE